MKKLLLLPLLLAMQEPTFPGCPSCSVVYGYVDLPMRTTTISNSDLKNGYIAIQGWGFRCITGNPVDRADLFIEDDYTENLWHPISTSIQLQSGIVPRPDVQMAYSQLCSNISYETGFIIWVIKDLPLGAHRFTVVMWNGPFHTNQIVTWNVVQ